MKPSSRRRLRIGLALALLAVARVGFAADDPASASDALIQARSHFEARRDLDATAAFARLASDDPRAAEPQFYLGLLALRRSDAAAAVSFLEKAVELSPATVSYRFVSATRTGSPR